MKYLIASFLITGILHGWLIVSQWGNNPSTLSYHAVKTKTSLRIYTITHLVTAVLLWLFMSQLFGGNKWSWLILLIAGVAAVAECLQAVIPSKGKGDVPHTVFAVIMAFSMWLLGLICTILFAGEPLLFWFNIIASLCVGSFFFTVRYPPKPGLWRLQYAGQFVLYLQIFLLVY